MHGATVDANKKRRRLVEPMLDPRFSMIDILSSSWFLSFSSKTALAGSLEELCVEKAKEDGR
jgi:hypothetical protein